jgi:hypothetical protein
MAALKGKPELQQEVFLELGTEKWREHIDLSDQIHGMLV